MNASFTPRWLSLANLLALAGTLAVNTAANLLPINGLNTGDVSAMYPNQFVPDGFTFSIWSLIYLWLIVYVGWGLNVAFTRAGSPAALAWLRQSSPWFWLSCLINVLWILAWHYLQVVLSLLLMLALLGTLVKLVSLAWQHRVALGRRHYWLAAAPFALYFGWICVATIANTTALLVHIQWSGWGLSPAVWSVVMMVIASILAMLLSVKWHQGLIAGVVAWALAGIYRGQVADSQLVGFTAVVLACILGLVAIWQIAYRMPKPPGGMAA